MKNKKFEVGDLLSFRHNPDVVLLITSIDLGNDLAFVIQNVAVRCWDLRSRSFVTGSSDHLEHYYHVISSVK